ncbi:MAG TPA: hypothetical protein VLA03_05825, partial [Draconibacterium sp.]|nr:hypothetical protein [Draconibacterium sp.]
TFRVENSVPQLWNPADGSIDDQLVFNSKRGGINVPIQLPPGGSVFIVFSKGVALSGLQVLEKINVSNNNNLPFEKVLAVNDKSAIIEVWQNGTYKLTEQDGIQLQATVNNISVPIVIDGEWEVKFDQKWGAPAEIVFPELISWTEHNNGGIKYYSGKGTYTKTITVPDDWFGEGQSIYIDLGKVGEVAEVYINGKSTGVLWKPPFRTDISKLVKPGANELKIEVMNLWINRLTGDMNLPEDKRFTKTNIRSDGGTWLANYSEWYVEPAGLLGPVRLFTSKEITVK